MPDSISSLGESYAPQETITSPSARTSNGSPLPSMPAAPTARAPSNSSFSTWQRVRTSRFGRSITGCR